MPIALKRRRFVVVTQSLWPRHNIPSRCFPDKNVWTFKASSEEDRRRGLELSLVPTDQPGQQVPVAGHRGQVGGPREGQSRQPLLALLQGPGEGKTGQFRNWCYFEILEQIYATCWNSRIIIDSFEVMWLFWTQSESLNFWHTCKKICE